MRYSYSRVISAKVRSEKVNLKTTKYIPYGEFMYDNFLIRFSWISLTKAESIVLLILSIKRLTSTLS